MRKKALSAIMILAFTVMINSSVFASSNELKQTQDNKAKLQTKVKQLNTQINSVIDKIDQNKKSMNNIARNIQTTEKKLKVIEDSSEVQNKLFKKRARAMYMSGIGGYAEILLTSNNINDFISRVDTISKIMKFDKNILDNLKRNQEIISSQKMALVSEKEKLNALKTANEATLAKLGSEISTQKKLLAQESKKESDLIAEENSRQLALNTMHNTMSSRLSRGGSISVTSSGSFTVNATAYCDGGITASGMSTRKGIIAVDPRVIPLGSRVYIEGYGYAIAADTGGAIRGNRIDLFFPSRSDAQSWGMRSVKIHILN
ncbi:MAG: 3D domain-containing protein [Clostridium sp.]|jgi:peptidoglycan hydrolase CwlO-like protein/3D (Asp-Asp-Asp) domain-containing protein|uniref:3D domain-containing protein n=1 Tax=Clostridium sp. TaxID=1506 RepID=UPI0025BE9373|nr:3D domain-containing protein [Clostridium sp.]MCH3963760.1 3D domain-containing protein [Clostridium sp.]MCI1714901.1 3D domain-containing protein [Clostridium sp.]MCI1798910.1 3D domain-containing protein [Clostridium sp.]MCI1813084.1 3D domain-containing protein [Clostridium sp.]MCI1869974.1 3D domain-containing protein [Clostridium sp.]